MPRAPCTVLGAVSPEGVLGPDAEDLGPADHPSWSSDGRSVAFVREGALLVRDAAGTRTLAATDVDALRALGVARWSSDGSTILFGRRFQRVDGRLCVVPAGGGDERCVGGDGKRYRSPALSPDGMTIVAAYDSVTHITPGGSTMVAAVGVARVTLATGEHAALPLDGIDPLGVRDIAWSPDGSRLAFVVMDAVGVDEGGPEWIHVASSAGGTTRRLTRASRPRLEGLPRWSPNGSWIAFSGHADLNPIARTRNVYVARVSDGAARRDAALGGASVVDWHR